MAKHDLQLQGEAETQPEPMGPSVVELQRSIVQRVQECDALKACLIEAVGREDFGAAAHEAF